MASHNVFCMMGADGVPRRGARRARVLMVAKLATSANELDVRIRDVSATGARVEGAGLPREGSDVILKRGMFTGFGHVVWRSGDNAGIQFDEAIEEAELMDRLKGMAPPPAVNEADFRRPGFNHRSDDGTLSDGRGLLKATPRRH